MKHLFGWYITIAFSLALATMVPLHLQAMPQAPHMATFTVNSTIDAVDADSGDGICATNGGVCTLRAAIQETNASPSSSLIILPSGIYTLTLAGVDEDAAHTGDLDIIQDIVIQGNHANDTIIDGNALDRVFQVHNVNATFTNLTIRNGQANDTSMFRLGGGAIRASNSSLSLEGVVLINNRAINSNSGGAIIILGSTYLHINSSTISNNNSSASGGAIANNFTSPTYTTTIDIKDTLFANNSGSSGGAISFFSSKYDTVSLQNVTFDNNQSSNLGGALNFSGNSVSATITNTSFLQNSSNSWGGAIYMTGITQTLSITNSHFEANQSATGSGGAIGLYNVVPIAGETGLITHITNTSFLSNTASSWGGAFHMGGQSNELMVVNSEFSYNTANQNGGAVSTSGQQATVSLNNSVFSQNAANGWGGVIHSYGLTTTISINEGLFDKNNANVGGAVSSSVTGPFGTIGVNTYITKSVFTENTANFSGGAIYRSEGTFTQITSSAFLTNTANNGGAMYGRGNGSSDSPGVSQGHIFNSTFSGNRALSSGGAIYSVGMNNDLWFKNVTIAYNMADSDENGSGNGGGIALDNASFIHLSNSLLANNIDGGNEAPDCSTRAEYDFGGGIVNSLAHNLIGKIDGCTNYSIPEWNEGDIIGTIAEPINPLLQSVTGFPAYHPLGLGSPAIDSGSNEPPHPAFNHSACHPVDQTNTLRPIDGNGDGIAICDIGAIEAPYRTTTTINPAVGNTLLYTGTEGITLTVVAPAGAVTETTTLLFTPVATVTAPANLRFANIAFDLTAYIDGIEQIGFQFAQPVTVVVEYTDGVIMGIEEETLILQYHNSEEWLEAACGEVGQDVVNNQLSVPICHLSRFALFGEPMQTESKIYLPLVTR